ncbi:hypothetical protein TrST_g5853 [Triparma strigata]|uniref:Tubulin delta chain n=1 Tax=Triparma strigata TaxID=1606541 RepID=A0A9W7B8V3_9STRA|nr:hypothetical protein TrST_g5853 [Triparma strigata]
MPTLTIQVGQCGNQLGSSILSSLASPSVPSPSSLTPTSLSSSASIPVPPPPSQFFRQTQRGTNVARAVLVDTEPKVVERCLNPLDPSAANFRYSQNNSCIIGAGGAANNWARGYSSPESVLTSTMEKVQSELEKSDYTPAVHILHSCAGGTGSGLGCALTREYNDEHGSKALIFNTIITPFETGEVIVQDYNAALTLSSLNDFSDGVLCIENEVASRACKKLLKIEHPGVKDLNGLIGDSVASIIGDSYTDLQSFNNAANAMQMDDILRHMVPNSYYKMMSLRMVPMMPERSVEFTRDTWESGVVKRLKQMHRCGTSLECDINWRKEEDVGASISNFLVLRGDGGLPRMGDEKRTGILDLERRRRATDNSTAALPTPPPNSKTPPKAASAKKLPPTSDVWSVDCSSFSSPNTNYVDWNNDPFKVTRSHVNFKRYEKMGGLLTNSDSCLKLLERVDNAKVKFDARAYVHQYEAYGVGVDEFEAAFLNLDETRARYRNLSK